MTLLMSVSDTDNEAVSSVQVLRLLPVNGPSRWWPQPVAAGVTALGYVVPQGLNTTAYYREVVAQADGNSIVTSPSWYTRRNYSGRNA